MFKKLAKITLAITGLLLGSTGAIAGVSKGAIVKNATLNLTSKGEVTVIAPDGENYSELTSSNLTFSGYAGASMKQGKVKGYSIYSGVCGPGLCGTPAFKRLHSSTVPTGNDFSDGGVFFTFSTDNFPQGLSNNIQAANIFQACNNRTSGGSGQADQTFLHNVQITLGLDTIKGFETSTVDYADDFFVPVIVRCQATSMIQAPPEPYSVDLRVTPQGETCPKKTEVRAFIKYKVPATALFRFKVDGKLSELHTIKARKVDGKPGQHTPGGGATYLVERIKTYYLDPGQRHFRIEVRGGKKSDVKTLTIDCPPFKVTSIWLSYEVENKQTCTKKVTEKWAAYTTRPGDFPFRVTTQGGLAVSQGIAYASREGDKYVARRTRHLTMGAFDQMMRVEVVNDPAIHDQKPLKVECLEVMSGTLELRKFAASRCEGEAAFSIRTNMPGDANYKLDCTGGRSWSGTVKAHNTGPDTYIGVGTKRFDVANNEQVNCALKTRKPFPVKILALRGNKYACHRSTVDTGSDDLAPNPGQQPDPPPVGRKLAGDFSFVDNGGTRCERQGSALINFKLKEPDNVHYSLDCTNGHFSGVAQAVSDGKGGYVAPALVRFDIEKTTHAKCALKSVAPGKPKLHVLKGHLFRCVIPEIEPGANDLVSDPRPPSGPRGPGKVVVDPPRVPPSTGPGRIVDPVRIVCLGGVVRNRSCTCPRTHKKTSLRKKGWRCDRRVVVDPPRPPSNSGPGRTVDPVRIACHGGVVRNRTCYCPRNHKRMPVGRNAYRCIANMVVVPPKQGGSSAATGGGRKTAVPPKRKRGATAGRRSKNRSLRRR